MGISEQMADKFHKILKKLGYKVDRRHFIEMINIYFDQEKDDIDIYDKPLFKTRVTIQCFRDKKLSAPIIEDTNNCVYNGRLSMQEFIFGGTINPEKHLTLNTIAQIPHSKNVFEDESYRSRTVEYFCIGNGAESKTVNGEIITERTSDTKLYNMVPFRCVPISADLTDEERENYRLRKQIRIKGADYYAYYAKKLTKSNVTVKYNGQDYIPKESDTSTLPDDSDDKPLRAGKVSIYTTFEILIDEKDFKEYYQANNNNSLVNASLNEIGLILALDAENSNENNKKELAGADLFAKMTFSKIMMDAPTNSAKFTYELHT